MLRVVFDPAEYEVLEHLARSRALDVYDVWSEERDSRCVAKALRPDRLEEPGPRRRLLRDGRILLAMAHPHVVRAYELVRGPRPVLILETLTGGSVQHMIDTGTARAPLPAVVELGVHLCSAMHYVHGQGLLHADLKPANVMSDRGFAKVIDFSHARCPGRAVRGRGTRAYMAPEQARGGRVGPPADVWGLGATLYAACVGRAHGRPQAPDRRPGRGRARRAARGILIDTQPASVLGRMNSLAIGG